MSAAGILIPPASVVASSLRITWCVSKRCIALTRPTFQHFAFHTVHYVAEKFLRLFMVFVPLLWFTLKEIDSEKAVKQRVPILED